MNYDTADRMMRDMNKRNLRAFSQLKTLKFDELNVLRAVRKVYHDSTRIAKKRYRKIAEDAFLAALLEAGISKEKAEEMTEDAITDDWVLNMLEDYDELTLYRFDHEAERKAARLAEALLASGNRGEETDKALRLWTLQVAQYADDTVVYATLDAYRAADVKKVMWIAVEDDKTCMSCNALHKKIFDIDKVPPRQHYRCRCTLKPVS